ncbi:hypothetical protein FC770_08420 [Nocardioides jishulii]|uniref:VOC family protein n=1 Tax=Nocardioides jishulii TaxID=2575440 RepID=A0A4U2YMC5_9ACTN|nr:hypothetical protein FC770_08420 [Nocardioides jishulii]
MVAVNHVGVSVAELGVARDFWIHALGASDHGGFSWPVGTVPADESLALTGTAAEVALLRTETSFLELFAFASPVPGERAADAPGVTSLVWAVDDPASTMERVPAWGGSVLEPDLVASPEGVRLRLVDGSQGTGLVGVEVRVGDASGHLLAGVPGPVAVALRPGALGPTPVPVDLGVNHVCLDVDGIDEVRAGAADVAWHHPVTESSGGAAAVCYGTTDDGVLVELLESRTDQAFLARCRLTRG